MVFTTPTLERVPQRIALNTRISGGQGGPILAAVVGEGGSTCTHLPRSLYDPISSMILYELERDVICLNF